MEQMSKYVRLTKGFYDKGTLVKPEEVEALIEDPSYDYYVSTYFYNDKQLEEFKQKGGSVKGIKEVKTNQLWWDFDSKDNIELARKDAVTLVNRLKSHSIDEDAIQVYFSGNKGYNVVLKLNKDITPEQAQNLALYKFGKDLKTLDPSLYDAVQVLRVPFTKHQVSGLYKIPLTTYDLENETSDTIREAAANASMIERKTYEAIKADDDFYVMEEIAPKKELKRLERKEFPFDVNTKPKGWKLSKWAIAQGYFEPGERNEAMMVLLATCRAMGNDLLGSYYIAKGALEKHKIRTGREDKFDKDELYNMTERVFSDEWEGGQYSEDHPLIVKICQRLGLPNDSKSSITELGQAFNMFKNYAQNIEKLTVKTGIKALDEKIRLTVGMSVGIIAGPGSGKTSLALQMLNNMSRAGHKSIIFSYDMFHSMVFQKLVQKHLNIKPDIIFEKFKSGDKEFERQCMDVLTEHYGNVDFCFEAGQNIQQIKDTIEEVQQKSGKPVKFIVVDYNELVLTDYSDPTQSSAFVAQKMREIANVYNLCVLSLFQPSKVSGDPSDEITSYRSAKGSSAIEQSVSVMFGVSRPGFNPRKPDNDKYITINCVKNRMGPIFALDLHWDGLTGTVRDLLPGEKAQLDKMREEKAMKDEKWEE